MHVESYKSVVVSANVYTVHGQSGHTFSQQNDNPAQLGFTYTHRRSTQTHSCVVSLWQGTGLVTDRSQVHFRNIGQLSHASLRGR